MRGLSLVFIREKIHTNPPHPMKHTLHLVGLGLLAVTVLSSCDTYVDARAQTHARPGYWNGRTHTHTDYHHYDSKPAPRRSGSLLNTNANLGLRL